MGQGRRGQRTIHSPKGIATDKAGNVNVADTDNNRIQVFTAKGAFLRKWGTEGDGNDQFLRAEDVNIAPDGTVWVADEGNERLQAFSGTGSFDTSISTPREAPRAIGVAADGSVLAAANGEERSGFRRWVEKPTGWEAVGGLMGAGDYRADEVEGFARRHDLPRHEQQRTSLRRPDPALLRRERRWARSSARMSMWVSG